MVCFSCLKMLRDFIFFFLKQEEVENLVRKLLHNSDKSKSQMILFGRDLEGKESLFELILSFPGTQNIISMIWEDFELSPQMLSQVIKNKIHQKFYLKLHFFRNRKII